MVWVSLLIFDFLFLSWETDLWNVALKADVTAVRLWCHMDGDVATLNKTKSQLTLKHVLVCFVFFPPP